MSDKPPTPPKTRRKGQFVPGDPRTKNGGRPKKTVDWKSAEDELRATLPRVLGLTKNELTKLLADNPTGYEMLAAKFLVESPQKAVERFLGKMPQVLTGAEGAPLVPVQPAQIIPPMNFDGWTPAQIDRYIEATSSAARLLAGAPKPA